jgi:ABC-type polysaccharide/polyol phosphate transport system ATPase subunit
VRAGEIALERACRSFRVRPDRPRTLKEVFAGRRGGRGDVVEALRDVTMRVKPGEAVGLVGRNGAGKTSTLRCLAGIIPLDSGRAGCGGRVVSLLELGAGFGAEFSGRENVLLNGALHGFSREEIEARMDEIVAFSELGEFMDVPVKAYSSGMFLRLGFSIAAHLEADVLLVDEILAVGDESFQRKCLRRIEERMAAGATLVLVSHDPAAIERVCRRVVVLDRGRIAFDGPVADGLLHYHAALAGTAGRAAGLELIDADGRPRASFRTGEAVRVRMTFTFEQPAERALAALEVRDARGATIFRTDAALGAVEDEVEATFDLPRLALLGGEYEVTAGAADHDAPAGAMLPAVTRLSVAATLDGEGIADLRGTWSVRAREAVT